MRKKIIEPGMVFTIPTSEKEVAHAVVLFVSTERIFLMGILGGEPSSDGIATLAELCDAVQLLLYSDADLIEDGVWPMVGQIALPDTMPLTERVVGRHIVVGNERIRYYKDKQEKVSLVSGSVGGRRFVEKIVQQFLGAGEKSLFTQSATAATRALLERCRMQ